MITAIAKQNIAQASAKKAQKCSRDMGSTPICCGKAIAAEEGIFNLPTCGIRIASGAWAAEHRRQRGVFCLCLACASAGLFSPTRLVVLIYLVVKFARIVPSVGF